MMDIPNRLQIPSMKLENKKKLKVPISLEYSLHIHNLGIFLSKNVTYLVVRKCILRVFFHCQSWLFAIMAGRRNMVTSSGSDVNVGTSVKSAKWFI